MTFYHVLGAVAALLLGVWLGMPGKYGASWRRGSSRRTGASWRAGSSRRTGTGRGEGRRAGGDDEAGQSAQGAAHDPRHLAELEGALARGGANSKTAKRHFTLFGGLISPKQRASVRRRGRRGRFQTSVPQPVDDDQQKADEQP